MSEIMKSLHRHCRGFGERTVEEIALNRFLKTFGTQMTFCVVAVTGKSRSTMVERKVCWTTSDDDKAKQRC